MRVALICETLALDMGYLTAVLPKYLARAGAIVHVVTMDLPSYYKSAEWRQEMPAFISGQTLKAGTTTSHEGFTVHVLGHGCLAGYPYAKGLRRCLAEIRPDVVYTATAIGALPLQAAELALELRFKLFTGNHTSAEAFPLARSPHGPLHPARLKALATRFVHGRLISLLTERCYCRTAGCAEIARDYFGVQAEKLRVVPLGVDTDHFFPSRSDEHRGARDALRQGLGFASRDIVCINTGRLIAPKRLDLLTGAVATLRERGLPFVALFIGDGPERAALEATPHCRVLPFRPFRELGAYYRAADIAVWPAGESTSMFDAAACGLPLVVNATIDAHLAGNGLQLDALDRDAMVAALQTLADGATRQRMGALGADQVRDHMSWERAARIRMRDFEQALSTR